MRANLTTARLRLRPLSAADEGVWLDTFNRPEVAHWLSAPPYPYTAADFAEFLATASTRALWVIEDESGACGSVALNPALGYWLAPRAQGRGYMLEAAQAVLADHFADPAANDVRSGYFEGNAASARVLTRLGFAETARTLELCRPLGRERPHVGMTLTREGYAAANPFLLTTPQLVLDPVTEADAPAIRRIVTDPRVGRMLFVFPPDLSEAGARDLACNWRWLGTPPFRLALRDAPGGALIGAIGLRALNDPEIYYFLAPERHGQGLMREALAAFIPAIAARFSLARLTAKVFADNPASARLLVAQGFRPSGSALQTSPARAAAAPAISYERP
ncbi:GNAT family N-acetyltransferase [Phaeovulum sp.]|uniref:GNAT family N-acetyltransferase n=1 Tax=Phaeovulum sp. TaxID=2934796 RepID=UPI0035653043